MAVAHHPVEQVIRLRVLGARQEERPKGGQDGEENTTLHGGDSSLEVTESTACNAQGSCVSLCGFIDPEILRPLPIHRFEPTLASPPAPPVP
jgi:hypothetical protein